jgi:hypothetical protein
MKSSRVNNHAACRSIGWFRLGRKMTAPFTGWSRFVGTRPARFVENHAAPVGGGVHQHDFEKVVAIQREQPGLLERLPVLMMQLYLIKTVPFKLA